MVRSTRRVVSGFGVLAALIALCQLTGSAVAGAQSQAATQRVIVVLKNQVKNLPPTRALIGQRRSAIALSQAPITGQLSNSGAKSVHSYDVINAVSATVSPSEESQLKSNPSVSEVIPDQIIHLTPPTQQAGAAASTSTAPGNIPLPGACAPPGQVQLNPQAIETIHADSQNGRGKTARSLGLTGQGVTVGFIADGLDPNNPDFIRANGQHVIIDYKDFSGEGTGVPTGGEEEFGDASSIAAQGREVYNVQGYSALGPNRQCLIRVEGVAPGASLVALDVFGGEDAGFNSEIVQAIDYAVSVDHVNVLNESFGNNFYPDDQASLDVIKQANDEAVAAGTTVTVSSGDAGVTSTIGTPSSDPNVISAGATTTYRIDGQDGYGGAAFPGVHGWLDNNISSFSSGGFEQSGRTVDVVAPGELNWALCSTDTAMFFECVSLAGNPTPVLAFGGTSESAPLTAGVAALVIQAYRQTHGGATPSPQVVKQIITSTADDIGAPAEQQGDGLIDAYKAGLAAESYNAPSGGANTLLTGADQLNGSALPGRRQTLTDTITNNGSRPERVTLSTRAIGTYRSLKSGTVVLSDTASPHITDWQGKTDNYEPFTFNVPAGQDRLNVAAAFQNAGNNLTDPGLTTRVRITLIDPAGRLAEYSVPQGDGNYGDVQITEPIAGRWTAYIYSRDSTDGGTTGPVVVGASSARYTRFGGVTPSSVRLAPGQSAPIRLTVSTPSQPGDAAGSILLSSGGQTQSTIAVTLRSLIPTGQAVFNGVLTGGNGREFQAGQMFTYQINLPANRPELNATVTLADNPNNVFDAWLVNPSGEAQAFAENTIPFSSGSQNELGTQLHVPSPQAGTWTLIVLFAPQVSGVALSEPFTVTTNQDAVPIQSSVPNSPSAKLTGGTAQTFGVTITNNGPDPEVYFLDARSPAMTTESLVPTAGTTNTVPEPDSQFNGNPEAVYLVPTHTTSLGEQASTTGPQPIEFDSTGPAGDPDLGSTVGSTASLAFSANPIEQGLWDIAPVEAGVFGTTGGPSETATTSMSVTTAAFDTDVTSPTGDLWQTSANPSAPFNPVVVDPGQTVTLPVTITPSAPSGSTVSGTLYVDDSYFLLYEFFNGLDGNDVAAIPYTYTVK